MATKSHILQDLQNLDEATPHEILGQIRHRRYILYKNALWQGEYNRTPPSSRPRISEEPRPVIMKGQFGMIFISLIALLLIFVPVLLFTQANWLLQRAPWILTAFGVIIKFFWSQLDIGVRLMEPYYILSKGHAPPRILALDYTGNTPFYLPCRTLYYKHYLLFTVSLNSICVEILTVCLSSLGLSGNQFLRKRVNAYSTLETEDAETFTSFWISFGLCIAILLSLSITAVLVYSHRRHAFLPRQPGTIASVLAFTHQSKFLVDLVDMETTSVDEVVKELEASGKTFGLGWFKGRDGLPHFGIDEEELLSRYVHGKGYAA